MVQLNLQFANTKDKIEDLLKAMTRRSLSLTITDNSASLLSIRTRNDCVAVRMHWMFLDAGADVISEIAGFIEKGGGRMPLVRKFINENRTCLKKKERSFRQANAYTQGKFYNLREIFDDLNNEYFEGNITASIGWGKVNSRRRVRKRTLGTFCRLRNTVRINPVLDRRTVPLCFIRFVVYHEMLHSEMCELRNNGRRSVHPPKFREREKLFKEYREAVSWEKRCGT